MATSLACGLVTSKFVAADDIVASDVIEAARANFESACDAKTVKSNLDVCAFANVVFLAVKPQYMPDVLKEISPVVDSKHLIISIAAGVTIQTLTNELGSDCRIVRVMPNTPCLVGMSASGFACGSNATDEDATLVERLLSTVGIALRVDERLIDSVTGLSGSGPAYVYQFIEALSDGGVLVGLPRHVATQLAAQTVMGAARMVLETGQHPGELKDAVASPGGTTIAGLHKLENGGFRGTVMNAVEAATRRAQELGRSE
jgi:pyrroline-5-carboxylate reductase